MAEENKFRADTPAAPPTSAATTATEMKTQGADTDQFRQAFDARKQGAQDNINSTLGASFNTQKQGLADAYQKNVTAQDQATAAGQRQFDFAKEDLGVQAGRTQQGMDSYADVRGLNRQAGSQQALSLGLGASVAAGRLAQQQQMALEESQRQKALLSTDYNNRVQKAISNHDYKQAAALLDDFNNQNTWLDKNAAAMATFGNFTGYEQLYGPGQAQAMQQFWIGSNPELAYNTGVIDAARYKQITGREAPDYVPPPSEGGGGGGTINADFWINGRPGWTVAHGGLGHGGGTSGGG
jgi:hypothetical protein